MMKFPMFAFVLALSFLGSDQLPVFAAQETSVTVAAASADISPTFDSAKMWRTADLRPGMRGYGLSVFSGLRPEKFDATVVGVVHGFMPGQDIILCQLRHPVLEGIGVVAGMSGSPVYVDGKLIGAVAYGWGNSIEPLAGVTPIEDMLKVYDKTPTDKNTFPEFSEEKGSRLSAFEGYLAAFNSQTGEICRSSEPQPVKVSTNAIPEDVRRNYRLPETVEARPLSTPVYVSGLSESGRGIQILRQAFPNHDFVPVAGTSTQDGANAENAPGGVVGDLGKFSEEVSGGYSLAVPFVEGDASMAGVGTVSWRNGNRLVAFGHPMFGEGPIRAPMAAARVMSVVKSSVRPFKLGHSIGQIGIILQDRRPAIGGLFGEKAPFFNASLTVDEPNYGGKKTFHYRMWANRDYSPMIFLATYSDAIDTVARTAGDMVLRFRYKTVFSDGTVFEWKDGFASNSSASFDPIISVARQIGLMMNNPWNRVVPTDVSMSVSIENKLQQATLKSVNFDKYRYNPGDTVRAFMEIEPYRNPRQIVETSFTLPQKLQAGTYNISFQDMMMRNQLEKSRNPFLSSPRDYSQLVKMLEQNRSANKIYITMDDKDAGLVMNGDTLPSLPPTALSALQGAAADGTVSPLRGNLIVNSSVATACEIDGVVRGSIVVEDPKP